MLAAHASGQVEAQLEALRGLIAERVEGRFAVFGETWEGALLPDGTEDLSGFVLDHQGRAFFFWTGWDHDRDTLTFTTWDETAPESHWQDIGEYREAREAVGLD